MHYSSRSLILLAHAILIAALPAGAQQGAIYTATVIPAVAQSGGSADIRIQIASLTTEAERTQLKDAFANGGSDKGVALLRSMSKGYINISGQSGRKVLAAFIRENRTGNRLILVTEHVLSEYESIQKIRAEDYPLTILYIQLDALGKPQSGEAYPAAKVTVTKDGFVDMATQTAMTATLANIVRAE